MRQDNGQTIKNDRDEVGIRHLCSTFQGQLPRTQILPAHAPHHEFNFLTATNSAAVTSESTHTEEMTAGIPDVPNTKRFRYVTIYFYHRADLTVHCSNLASENGTEAGRFKDCFQV